MKKVSPMRVYSAFLFIRGKRTVKICSDMTLGSEERPDERALNLYIGFEVTATSWTRDSSSSYWLEAIGTFKAREHGANRHLEYSNWESMTIGL